MDCHGSHGPPAKFSPEALPLFSEGIHLILSRWTALRLAVENEWGGRTSRQKFDNLVVDLISWFTSSKDILYIDELETMLDENMLASFNAEIEDGSIEEVAEQLMTLHEECLQGNFESLLSLRSSSSTSGAVSGSRQVIDQNEDDSSDEDMALDVDMQEEKSVVGSSAIQLSSEIRIQNGVCGSAQEPNHASDMSMDANVEETKDAGDGWTVITSKRNRGRKSR
ncbi:Pre-rRNA-processing TSR2-like protein [Nymphaea thermarum]|nr:Pre-rRNA-processing TSR2-like protein [Nymphaea thermarum]